MTTFLVVAVLLLCGMAIWGVKIIAATPNQQSTPAYAFLGVSVVLALKILLSMMQTEFTRRDIRADISKTRHDLRNAMDQTTSIVQVAAAELSQKTNGGLSRAVSEVGEQVRKAEHDQMMDDPGFRRRIAEELCPMLSDDVVRRVLEGLRDGEGAERRIDRPQYPPSVQT